MLNGEDLKPNTTLVHLANSVNLWLAASVEIWKEALRVTEKVVEAHFQMFKAPVGYLQLMFSRRSCFDKMQNPVSLWDKFGFSAGAKEGKSYICHMAPIHSHSEHYENEGGMVCLRKLSPQQNLSTCILSLFISNCVGGKKIFFMCCHPLHPGISLMGWSDFLLATFVMHLRFPSFRLPYLNLSTHMCTLQSCC